MSDPLITLTTDFGEDSPYVAVLKGVILGINPAVRIIDLSHQIPPQDVQHAAYFLATALPYFPASALHVVIVDPGVGSERALLYISVGRHRLLAPDNGCWTLLAGATADLPEVICLSEPRWWRHPVSATFHGRDILAPTAAHLSLGADPQLLGSRTAEWVRLEVRPPLLEARRLVGEVVFVDHFGNLLTNIPGDALVALSGQPLRVRVGRRLVSRCVRTYAEALAGNPVALVSSSGSVEVAVVRGNAARQLRAGVGTPVEVEVLVPRSRRASGRVAKKRS